MKVFLLDGSVNQNSWGVRPDSINANIGTAIGKPLVLFKNALGQYDHPSLNDKSYEHALQYQDLYRVGTFVDVHESPVHKGRWYGTAEITDEDFKRAVKEDPSIPFYVSPTIRILKEGQNDRDLTDWSFIHSAIVDRPAFGIHSAFIGSHCTGDSNTCLLQLRKASIESNGGKIGCGFCTYKAAKEIQKLVSSHDTTSSSFNSDNLSNVYRASEGEAERKTKTEVKEKTDLGTGQTEVKEKTKTEIESDSKSASNKELLDQIETLTKRNKELELRVSSTTADKDGLQTIVGQLNEEVTKLKQAAEAEQKSARLKEITDIVDNAVMFRGMSSEQKQRTIDNFATGGMPLEQIKEMLIPLEANVKKLTLSASAGPAYRSSSLQLGQNNRTIETKSASRKSDDEIPYYLQLGKQMFKGQTEGGIA